MDISAIGSASVAMSLARVQQDAGVAVLKKAMGQEEQAASFVQEMLPPPSNHILDILA